MLLIRVWRAHHLRDMTTSSPNSRNHTRCLRLGPSLVSYLHSSVLSVSLNHFLFQLFEIILLLSRPAHHFFSIESLMRDTCWLSFLLIFSSSITPPTHLCFIFHGLSWHIETAVIASWITLSASHEDTHRNVLWRLATVIGRWLNSVLAYPFVGFGTHIFTHRVHNGVMLHRRVLNIACWSSSRTVEGLSPLLVVLEVIIAIRDCSFVASNTLGSYCVPGRGNVCNRELYWRRSHLHWCFSSENVWLRSSS